jgi:hypothetical protein
MHASIAVRLGPVPVREMTGRAVKLPGADWKATATTITLQISSTCRFRDEGMPFYRSLVAARQRWSARIQLAVAAADAVGAMHESDGLSRYQISPMVKPLGNGSSGSTTYCAKPVIHACPDSVGTTAA